MNHTTSVVRRSDWLHSVDSTVAEQIRIRCYWSILINHPIAASAHGSTLQQLSLLNATIDY